jgi:hypothetical protein
MGGAMNNAIRTAALLGILILLLLASVGCASQKSVGGFLGAHEEGNGSRGVGQTVSRYAVVVSSEK